LNKQKRVACVNWLDYTSKQVIKFDLFWWLTVIQISVQLGGCFDTVWELVLFLEEWVLFLEELIMYLEKLVQFWEVLAETECCETNIISSMVVIGRFYYISCLSLELNIVINVGLIVQVSAFEPRDDKTNIMGLRPAWIQTSLRIRTVWSGSKLFAISFSTCYRVFKRTAWILIRLRGCVCILTQSESLRPCGFIVMFP
jgi:hypothetical protein